MLRTGRPFDAVLSLGPRWSALEGLESTSQSEGQAALCFILALGIVIFLAARRK